MTVVHSCFQDAIESDPHKKGVQLYIVKTPRTKDYRELWVWCRNKRQALAAVSELAGFTAYVYKPGIVLEPDYEGIQNHHPIRSPNAGGADDGNVGVV